MGFLERPSRSCEVVRVRMDCTIGQRPHLIIDARGPGPERKEKKRKEKKRKEKKRKEKKRKEKKRKEKKRKAKQSKAKQQKKRRVSRDPRAYWDKTFVVLLVALFTTKVGQSGSSRKTPWITDPLPS